MTFIVVAFPCYLLIYLFLPQVTVFADSLIPSVRRALCDPLPEVREAAARTFDNLHHNIGSRALDEILPDLLKKLVRSFLVQPFISLSLSSFFSLT